MYKAFPAKVTFDSLIVRAAAAIAFCYYNTPRLGSKDLAAAAVDTTTLVLVASLCKCFYSKRSGEFNFVDGGA